MRRGRSLILLSLLLVLSAVGIFAAFSFAGIHGTSGNLTCYTDNGVVIFSEDVTGLWIEYDRMWHFDGGGISITRPCVFVEDK